MHYDKNNFEDYIVEMNKTYLHCRHSTWGTAETRRGLINKSKLIKTSERYED